MNVFICCLPCVVIIPFRPPALLSGHCDGPVCRQGLAAQGSRALSHPDVQGESWAGLRTLLSGSPLLLWLLTALEDLGAVPQLGPDPAICCALVALLAAQRNSVIAGPWHGRGLSRCRRGTGSWGLLGPALPACLCRCFLSVPVCLFGLWSVSLSLCVSSVSFCLSLCLPSPSLWNLRPESQASRG